MAEDAASMFQSSSSVGLGVGMGVNISTLAPAMGSMAGPFGSSPSTIPFRMPVVIHVSGILR